MLTVIHGPLPQDGDVIHPDVDLESWISQSEIFGLSLGAFVDTPLNSRAFVFAGTEPPPTQDRIPGVLWFKRGEGRLYKWDRPDSPSTLTYADVNWVSISDRRDYFFRAAHAITAGQYLQFMESPSETQMLATMTEQGAFVKYGARWIFPVSSPGSGVTNSLLGVGFIALDAGNSGALVRCVDWGFCDILTASGDTGAAGILHVNENASLTHFAFTSVPSQATNLGRMPIAFSTTSTPSITSDFFLRPAFKFISIGWAPSTT